MNNTNASRPAILSGKLSDGQDLRANDDVVSVQSILTQIRFRTPNDFLAIIRYRWDRSRDCTFDLLLHTVREE